MITLRRAEAMAEDIVNQVIADIELELDEELTMEGNPQDITKGVHCTPSHTFCEPQGAVFHSLRPNLQLFNEELSCHQPSSPNGMD
jgi:hypothetical protein